MCSQVVADLFLIPLLSLDLDVESLSQFLLLDNADHFYPVLLKNFPTWCSYHRVILLINLSIALRSYHMCFNTSLYNIPVIDLGKRPWEFGKIPKSWSPFQRTFILLQLPRSWSYPRIISSHSPVLVPHRLAGLLCTCIISSFVTTNEMATVLTGNLRVRGLILFHICNRVVFLK